MEKATITDTGRIAMELVDCCNRGEYEKAYRELYSPDIVSIETEDQSDMARLEGMDALMKKVQWWQDTFEAHSSKAMDPVVADNWFSVKFEMDTTHRPSGKRSTSSEIGVYKVQDGKIVREQFFYDIP